MVVSGCPAQRKQSNEIRQHNSIKLKITYLHGEQPLVVGLVAACGGRIGKVLLKTLEATETLSSLSSCICTPSDHS